MSHFAVVHSRALDGLSAPVVHVEVHLANGLPSFTMVGLADIEVREARERVRSALQNSGLEFPSNKRITVNLAPADLPKDSGRFDLPIALGILAASGQIAAQALYNHVFAGELSLAGELRPVHGALAMALAIQTESAGDATTPSLVLPQASAQEAALVPGTCIYAAHHLLDVVRHFQPAPASEPGTAQEPLQPVEQAPRLERVQPRAPTSKASYADLADVKGQAAAKRGLEIAAAGGHSVLLVGPPGAGKSMLAHRFVGLLPPLQLQQSLETAALADLAGRFKPELFGVRPISNPHHSASAVALVGGGSPPRPGEISMAHNGVLFLDEILEFPKTALEALREPLENGCITIARAARRAEFPARFQLIAAMNPCPCGYFGSSIKPCRCTPDQVSRYQGKLSGPLLDRIDLQIEVPALPPDDLLHNTAKAESSAQVAERVALACQRADQRQGSSNAQLQGQDIELHCQLDPAAREFLRKAATRLAWSGRGTHRALKVARSIADLAGSRSVTVAHLAEAMQYRRALRSMQ